MIKHLCGSFSSPLFSKTFVSLYSTAIRRDISEIPTGKVAKKIFDEKPIEEDSNGKCEFFPLDSLDESKSKELDESITKIHEWNLLVRKEKRNHQ